MKPTFTIEKFSYERHLMPLRELLLSPESQDEVDSCGLREHLGYTTTQVLLDYLIGAEEAFVFISVHNHMILGIAGVSQGIMNGEISVFPWFLSDGFQQLPWNTKTFMRAAKVILGEWEHLGRTKNFLGTCQNIPENKCLLQYLGFSWEHRDGPGIIKFRKKGGQPYGIAVSYGSPVNGHHP